MHHSGFAEAVVLAGSGVSPKPVKSEEADDYHAIVA
jgi:hypothetical protein